MSSSNQVKCGFQEINDGLAVGARLLVQVRKTSTAVSKPAARMAFYASMRILADTEICRLPDIQFSFILILQPNWCKTATRHSRRKFWILLRPKRI